MSTAQLAPGTAVEGYTVQSGVRTRVGAITYAAVDAAGTALQLTVYEAECFPSALVLERSLRELRQLQTLQHPRIVRVYACGKLGNGATWEAHDPLPQASLADHLRGGALPEADALAIAQQIGEALGDAQKVGVIHRNLGADVVFPSPDGVVVAGFAVGAPQGGRSFGALDSIAPEQVEGKVVDQRTLIYNLAALVHFMMRGTPLFTGDTASVLQGHLTTDVADIVAAPLRRGLSKDPRMRPMMLKQFVSELASGLSSAAGRAPAAPTSRGWTMFTSAIESEPATAAGPPAPAPDAPVAPSTRGWTMFMQDGSSPAATNTDSTAVAPAPASDGGTAVAPMPAAPPTETPAAATPAAATPPGAAAPTAAKPSTRGWTMFMQAQDDAPAPAAAPEPEPTGDAAPLLTVPSQPPATDAAPKPSTRGWTMFTRDDEAAAATPPTSVDATVVAPPRSESGPALAAPPDAAAATAAAPPVAGEAPKPSTRGWTMFTRDDEAAAAAPSPDTVSPAAAAAASAQTPTALPPDGAADAGQPPSSRGWTVFMEPAAAAGVAAAADAMSAPAPAEPPPSVPTPSVPVPGDDGGQAGAPGGPRRGWTMFMEAPIDDAGRRAFGPSTPPGAAPAAAVPTPAEPAAEEPSSDNRGWTVFGAPAPGAPPSAATVLDSLPATPPAVALPPPPHEHGSDAQSRGAHDASVAPTASGSVTATAEPDPAPGRSKTVVATGVAAVQGNVGGVTGRTVFPAPGSPGGGEMPDTMYFRRGDIQPERPTARSTAVDVVAPARPSADDRNAGGGAIVAPGRDAPIARSSGRRVVPFVVLGVVGVGLLVAAAMYFT